MPLIQARGKNWTFYVLENLVNSMKNRGFDVPVSSKEFNLRDVFMLLGSYTDIPQYPVEVVANEDDMTSFFVYPIHFLGFNNKKLDDAFRQVHNIIVKGISVEKGNDGNPLIRIYLKN